MTDTTQPYPPIPASSAQPQIVIQQAPAPDRSRRGRDGAQYVRQQKGHSLTLNLLLIGPLTMWITTLYYSLSPNHYWHA